MRKQEDKTVMTFYTTAAAMRCEQLCRENDLPGRLFPAPRSMTADCGIAWQSPAEWKDRLLETAQRNGLEYEQCLILRI